MTTRPAAPRNNIPAVRALLASIGYDPANFDMYNHVYFDQVSSGTAAGEFLFFPGLVQRVYKYLTNLEGAGILPSTEKFIITGIGLALGGSGAASDANKVLDGSVFELEIAGRVVFSCPASRIGYQALASVGDKVNQIKPMEYPLLIPAGGGFKGRLITSIAAAAAIGVKLELEGVRVLPSSKANRAA